MKYITKRERIASAYFSMLKSDTTVALTITSNYNSKPLSKNALNHKINVFINKLMRLRGGRHHYKKGISRPRYILIPEKFSVGSPHFHGVFEIPSDLIERFGRKEAEERISSLWKETIPSGTIDLSPIFDMDGWASYCSKECGVGDDHVLISL